MKSSTTTVWVKRGLCSADSLLNILLCVLGYVCPPPRPFLPSPPSPTHNNTQIPGLLHAWYVIARYPEDEGYYEGLPEHNESGRVTYVFVQHPGGQGQGQGQGRGHQQQPQRQPKPQHQGGMNYGTTTTTTTTNATSSAPAHQHDQENGGEGGSNGASSANPPPTYAEAVKGDNKIQTHD